MAVTANQIIKRQGGRYGRKSIPVAASKNLYEGTFVFLDAAGRATDVKVDANTIFAGIAIQQADNSSGAAGDINVEVYTNGDFELAVGSLALANGGAAVYASDNYTATLTATANPRIGMVSRYLSSGVGIVGIHGIGEAIT